MNPTALHALESCAAGESVPPEELRLAAAVMLEAWEILSGGVEKALKEAADDRWAIARLAVYDWEARGIAEDPLAMYRSAPDLMAKFLASRALAV